MWISETNNFVNDAMFSYAAPPLETAGTGLSTEKWIGGTVCITVQLAARLA